MTPIISRSHFEKLGELLDRIGLRDEHGRISDPRRVLNSDECPNPWRGTGDRGKVIAEVGKPCIKLVTSARQHTSLDVLVGMDGHLYGPHIIFQGTWVQRQMIPRVSDIPYSKVSVSEKGYQTGCTLLETLKFWHCDLLRRKVPFPVVWCSDGHASRLNTDVLRWCRENQWIMYISPPHTTGIHQPLDQIFRSWHKAFNARVKSWSDANTGREVDKAMFTNIFSEAWPSWTTPDSIVAAFRKCGISMNGLDPEAIPKAKFVLSTTLVPKPTATDATTAVTTDATTDAATPAAHTQTTATVAPAATPAMQTRGGGSAQASPSITTPASSTASADWVCPSPDPAIARDTMDYWKAKAELAVQAARAFRADYLALKATPLTLRDSHPSFQVKHAAPPEEDKATRKQRVKGQWGDMDSLQMLEQLEGQTAEEEQQREEAAEKKQAAAERKQQQQELAQQKQELRDLQRITELPVLHLLKHLQFCGVGAEEVSAKELSEFVRLNRAVLRSLNVDLKNPARKTLMPLLVPTVCAASPSTQWVRAPPLALLPPPEEATPAPTPQDPPPMPMAVPVLLTAPAAGPITMAIPMHAPLLVPALAEHVEVEVQEPAAKRMRPDEEEE